MFDGNAAYAVDCVSLSTALGKVTSSSLSEPRGPDVTHSIRVPEAWLAHGQTIEVELPRQLNCAQCHGGGCDQCERAGALRLRTSDEPAQTLRVSLPDASSLSDSAAGKPLLLRIPEAGGLATTETLPRGCLMLQITTSTDPDPSVRLIPTEVIRELRAPPEVIVRSAVIAGLLLLLFLWMMHLSGWLF